MKTDDRHYPGPLAAVIIVLGAWLLMGLGAAMQADLERGELPDIGALGVAQALGFGLAATLAARRVPGPQAERLGLLGFSLRYVPMLLLLIPMLFVMSELDNWVALLIPGADPESVAKQLEEFRGKQTLLSNLQMGIALIGIAPVVEEWLFRGVVLQGAVAHLGRTSGLVFTSALYALGNMTPMGTSRASITLTAFLSGLVLGVVRLATGSLLATILVHAAWSAIGLVLIVFADEIPISGFNTLEGHTPLWLIGPCLLAVAWSLSNAIRAMRERPAVLPIVEPEPDHEDDDEGPGGFF